MNSKNLSVKLLPLPLLVAVLFMLAAFLPLAASVTPLKLQCEYRTNPLGIDVTQPRLFWQLQSDERSQTQTAYQILVASSAELLEKKPGGFVGQRQGCQRRNGQHHLCRQVVEIGGAMFLESEGLG